MKNKRKIRGIAAGAIIAASYVVLTYIAAAFNLSSGAIQIRLSEALTILPIFTPYAIPGVFIGCLLANLLTGCAVTDVIFGSLATLIGAIGTYFLRKKPILATIPPILANAIIVPFILIYVYNLEGAYPYFFLTVLAGEVISCGVLGLLLRKGLVKRGVDKYL
ncbi:MAG: QueT transporter family protein [Clostridia bacterium]|nr:QueT transporter family protein [Clostridia bacterium]